MNDDAHVVAGDDTEHEPAARAGIAEVERRCRRSQTADALAKHLEQRRRCGTLGTERLHRSGRRHDIVRLEQPVDARAAGGQRAARISARWEIDLSPAL